MVLTESRPKLLRVRFIHCTKSLFPLQCLLFSNVSIFSIWINKDALITLKRRQKEIYRLSRVPAFDIRHKYIEMMKNVLNSYDFGLIQSFWMEFGSPKVCFRRTFNKLPDGIETIPTTFTITGLVNNIAFWCSLLQILPDHIFDLRDGKIHTRSDVHGSVITVNYISHCSFIYELTPLELTLHFMKTNRLKKSNSANNVLQSSQSVGSTSSNRKSKIPVPPTEPLRNYIEQTKSLPRLLPAAVSYSVEAKVCIYLNAMKQITGIDIKGN